MGAVGVGQRRRLKIGGGRKPRRDIAGQRKSGHAAERMRDLGQRALHLRNAFDADLAVDQLEVVGGDLQHGRGRPARLVGDHQRGQMHGVAGGHRLPAGIGAKPERTGRGVAVGDVNMLPG